MKQYDKALGDLQTSGVSIVNLYQCLRSKIETHQIDNFINFCKELIESNKQNREYSCNHKFKDVLMMIDSLEWPVTYQEIKRVMKFQKLVMEENIMRKSRFVIKEGFDLGIKDHYSHIAFNVQHTLKTKGYDVKQNSDLERDKKTFSILKKDMIRTKISSNQWKLKIPPISQTKFPKVLQYQNESPRRVPIKCPKLKKKYNNYRKIFKQSRLNTIDQYFMYDQLEKLKSSKSQCSLSRSP